MRNFQVAEKMGAVIKVSQQEAGNSDFRLGLGLSIKLGLWLAL